MKALAAAFLAIVILASATQAAAVPFHAPRAQAQSLESYPAQSGSATYYVKYTEYLNNLTHLDGNVNNYSDIPGPAAMLYSQGTGSFYAASNISSLYTVQPSSLHTTVFSSLGMFPAALSFVKRYNSLYILPGHSNMTMLNLSTSSTENVSVGYYPQDLAYYPAKEMMFVTSQGNDRLVAVNLTSYSVAYSVPLRFGPFGVAYDSANGYIYFSYPDAGLVSVYNPLSRSFVSNVTIGGAPYKLAVDASSGNVYVSNQGLNQLDVINGSSQALSTEIDVGSSPSGVAYDSAQRLVFIANTDSSNITVVSAASGKVVQNIDVGSQPYSLAYDENSSVVAVGNHGSDSISYLYPVTMNELQFNETGLPVGTTWHVTVNGHTRFTDTGSLIFNQKSGTANYSASPEKGYYLSTSGKVSVQGATVVDLKYHSVAALHNEMIGFSVLGGVIALIVGLWLFRGRKKE